MGLGRLFSRRIPSEGGSKYLIVGLGNIGSEYASTRHNVGFMVLDAWAQASNLVFSSKRYGSVAEVRHKGRTLVLLKPSTYMNLSGNAVRYWMDKLKIPASSILVICDDLNLPFGTVRMRPKGSDGGHNGLKNIQEMLGTSEYARIRIGIGNAFKQGQQVDFVLGEIPPEEMEQMGQIEQKVIEGAKTFCLSGVEIAMNLVNTKTESH